MIFNSLVFLIFALAFFGLWRAIETQSRRLTLLVMSSFVFYGWFRWEFIFLLILNGLVDFFMAKKMDERPGNKKFYLLGSIVLNFSMLGVFKYSDFFMRGLNQLLGTQLSGYQGGIPLGISFYTFQSMSYTIDVFRGEIKATKSMKHFFAYLACFPQLVAGPIVRARDLLPQLLIKKIPREVEFYAGFRLILEGYFLKVIIADNMAATIDHAYYTTYVHQDSLYWWFILTSFAIQIYGDFCGYSRIARGLMACLGYPLPKNFNHPFTAESLSDFWNRWHISLSTWFRDYVYIPLGGNRSKHIRNILITMGISGLWHGAGAHFVLWGIFHGLAFAIEQKTQWIFKMKSKYLRRFFVLGQCILIGLFFRCQNDSLLIPILKNLFSFQFSKTAWLQMPLDAIFAWIMFFALAIYERTSLPLYFAKNKASGVVTGAALIVFIIYFRGISDEFIYFVF